jgi:glucose/arabinose dehydrogenase
MRMHRNDSTGGTGLLPAPALARAASALCLLALASPPAQSQVTAQAQGAPPIRLVYPGVPADIDASLASANADIARMTVREGFVVEAAVPRVEGTRFIEFAPDGRLFISRPRFEDILVLEDADRDGVFESLRPYVTDVPGVHGLCWFVPPAGSLDKPSLWFSTSSAIVQTRDADNDGKAESLVPVLSDLPSGGMHWWRSILVTGEHIYTSIGDSENITDESATDRQKIWRYSLSGSDKTLFASGVRNTEKLRLRPGTSEVWGVDHGSDWFGRSFGENADVGQPITDENPPDEFNHYEQGKFYGHPFIVGSRIPRNEFRERADIVQLAAQTQVPAWSFGAHWASNSFTFIDPALATTLPPDFAGDAIVASRGSWNRSERAGYQVGRVLFDKDKSFAGRPFGYQTLVRTIVGEQVLARPVDVTQGPDGHVYFSTDLPVGRVYRLRWAGNAEALPAEPLPTQTQPQQ